MEFNGKRNDVFIVDVNAREKSPFHPRLNDIQRFRLRKSEIELLEINQPITFKAMNNQEKMVRIRTLGDWLIYSDWKKLSFDDEPGQSYNAILNDVSNFVRVNNTFLFEGTLNFLAKETLGAPKSINLTPVTQTHTITGQTETPWTAEVTFTESANRFELWAGENYVQLNYEFMEGDKLIVEYTGRKVTLNGNDLRKSVSMSSHFEELKPGNVSVRASHAAVLKYDERYY